MKLAPWVRFTWNLSELVVLETALPPHYHFAPARGSDEKELRTVITRAVAHENSWGESVQEITGMIDAWLERAFEPENGGLPLTLRHGLRIIGAAILMPDAAAEDHLSPGPCVLLEYRNRGLGTALLGESLRQLREAGLSQAAARAKLNSPVAKFLYPKFNGRPAPDDKPLLAA